MNILSAIYSGHRGLLKSVEKFNRSAQASIENSGPELALQKITDETQLKASVRSAKISDDLLKELVKASS